VAASLFLRSASLASRSRSRCCISCSRSCSHSPQRYCRIPAAVVAEQACGGLHLTEIQAGSCACMCICLSSGNTVPKLHPSSRRSTRSFHAANGDRKTGSSDHNAFRCLCNQSRKHPGNCEATFAPRTLSVCKCLPCELQCKAVHNCHRPIQTCNLAMASMAQKPEGTP